MEAGAEWYGYPWGFAGLGGGFHGGSYCGETYFRLSGGLGTGGGFGIDPWARPPGHGSYVPRNRAWPQLGIFGQLTGEAKVAFGPAEVGYSFGNKGLRWGGDTAGPKGFGESRGWFGRASPNLLDYIKPWKWRGKATANVRADFGVYVTPAPF